MKNKITSILALNVITSMAFAGTMGESAPAWSDVFELSLGPAWVRAGDTQTFYLTPEIEKTYAAQKKTSTTLNGELFAGMQHSVSDDWLGQLGLAVAGSGIAKAQGIIWDDADPQFDNHSYQYKVMSLRLGVKGKLLLVRQSSLTPFVSALAGVAFNRAYDYSNTSLIFPAIVNPNFASNTKTSFTYSIGLGVQKLFNDNYWVAIRYEFSDWGKSQLGRAEAQTLNSGPGNNHMYANGVNLSVGYNS